MSRFALLPTIDLEIMANEYRQKIQELQDVLTPIQQELMRRGCEGNPYLAKLRDGAEITEKRIAEFGTIFVVNGVKYTDVDEDMRAEFDYLSELSDCPQVKRETLKERHYESEYRLVIRPAADGGAE